MQIEQEKPDTSPDQTVPSQPQPSRAEEDEIAIERPIEEGDPNSQPV